MTGHVLPVDLDMLSAVRESDSDMSTDGYLDLHSGEVVGADATVDVEADPERWLRFETVGSRDGWE
ncbi:MAG: hypothetical protein WAX14_11160 [Rhodococcus sp. (in: high G+C Gram-positive bacteria)]|uniref:hypothetical protein n=1 Tax=Rhodococcus sp. TaxID=1831 RepID=UPI003BB79457